MIALRQFYIDGRWVEARSAAEQVLVDASSEEAFGVVALASETDVDAAVAAARRALPAWSATSLAERIAFVPDFR